MKLRNAAQVLTLLVLVASPGWAAPVNDVVQPELLEVEQAFRASARLLDANTVELNYRIADGYYMYRARFKFDSEEGQPALGRARIPAGTFKQDATFGRVETYRKSVRVLLPLANTGKGTARSPGKFITLQATSQGCADAGVCYPPQRHQFRLERGSSATVLPLATASSGFSSGSIQGEAGGSAPPSGRISELIKRAP